MTGHEASREVFIVDDDPMVRDVLSEVFDQAGHYPFLEHAQKFNSLVLEFLKSPS